MTEILHVQEPDTGVSITAQLSDHRARLERAEEQEDPITEQPEESENASSPPGSIVGEGDRNHDIMSENIKLKHHKFGKSHNKPYTVKETANLTDEEGVSKEAHHESEATQIAPLATISPPLPVPETSRSIQNFYVVYDKLYAEFRQELVQEYAQMRGCYMGEYQDNYEQNTSRRDDRVSEMNRAITTAMEYN